jgi:CBS domain containing-hemolysin-like protein
MVNLSRRSGGITMHQETAIENVLTLQRKTAKEVMTPRTVIFSLPVDLTLEQARDASEKWEHSRFPVYGRDPEDVVGVVLAKELFMALCAGRRDMKISELLRPVHFVVETAPLNLVLMDFLERREHMFIVIDEYGGLSGLITSRTSSRKSSAGRSSTNPTRWPTSRPLQGTGDGNFRKNPEPRLRGIGKVPGNDEPS